MVTAAILASAPATNVQADGMVRDALAEAGQMWEGWGYKPLPPVLRVYDEPKGSPAVARAFIGQNIILVDRSWRNQVWEWVTEPLLSVRERGLKLGVMVSVLAHEVGHTLGFGHASTGIMRNAAETPGRCFSWATRWIKQLRRKAARMGS